MKGVHTSTHSIFTDEIQTTVRCDSKAVVISYEDISSAKTEYVLLFQGGLQTLEHSEARNICVDPIPMYTENHHFYVRTADGITRRIFFPSVIGEGITNNRRRYFCLHDKDGDQIWVAYSEEYCKTIKE